MPNTSIRPHFKVVYMPSLIENNHDGNKIKTDNPKQNTHQRT